MGIESFNQPQEESQYETGGRFDHDFGNGSLVEMTITNVEDEGDSIVLEGSDIITNDAYKVRVNKATGEKELL